MQKMDLPPQNSAQLFFFFRSRITCGVFGVLLPNHMTDLQGPSVAGLGSSISSGRSHVTRLGSITISPVPMGNPNGTSQAPLIFCYETSLHSCGIFSLKQIPWMFWARFDSKTRKSQLRWLEKREVNDCEWLVTYGILPYQMVSWIKIHQSYSMLGELGRPHNLGI